MTTRRRKLYPFALLALLAFAITAMPVPAPASSPGGCTAVASVLKFGTGTPGALGVPKLTTVGGPVIGTSLAFRVTNGLPFATGTFVAAANGQERYLSAYDAYFYPKTLRYVVPFTLDANGNSPKLLEYPLLPSGACGLTYVCQALVDDPAAYGGKCFTAGMRLRFGRSDAEAGTQLQFSGSTYSVGKREGVAIGDFNGDDVPDFAVAGWNGVSTRLGVGDGTFGSPLTFGTNGSRSVALADLNNDGKLDVTVGSGTHGQTTGRVQSWLGAGDGTFGSSTSLTVPPEPRGIALGDLNGDGIVDLTVATWGDWFIPGGVAMHFGNGAGAHGSAQSSYGDLAESVAIGDLNGDGIVDWVYCNIGEVGVYLGQGAGVFGAPVAVAGDHPTDVAIADINGDLIPDLIVANGVSGTVSVRIGVGDGTFTTPVSYPAGVSCRAVTVADMSGDGVPDLIAGGGPAGTVVLLGFGDGTFGPFQSFAFGDYHHDVDISDLDSDGDNDLIIVHSDGVSILLNQ